MSISFGFANVMNSLGGISSAIASTTSAVSGVINAGRNAYNVFTGNTSTHSGANTAYTVSRSTGHIDDTGPTTLIMQYIRQYSDNSALKYIYERLFSKMEPDISGYVLLFMVPPTLSGFKDTLGNSNYDSFGDSFVTEVGKLVPLLATNFTPPVIQLTTSTISGTSGTQHAASELNISDNMSITFIDDINLDIYAFHKSWIDYIFQILEGTLTPSQEVISERIIDYAASFYFVKWQPDMNTIQYIGKAVGCFPKDLPSTEIIGNRATNDFTTITFNYTVSDFKEATMLEKGNWLFDELNDVILSQFNTSS